MAKGTPHSHSSVTFTFLIELTRKNAYIMRLALAPGCTPLKHEWKGPFLDSLLMSVLSPFPLNPFAELSCEHCPPSLGLLSLYIGHLAPLSCHAHC